ncbi:MULTISPECIES: ABC transporter substrate-binding protein [unclassified Lentimicrobium]|uniref:ABC transporter substrate-binding protein n=1 Tax=unclassified Lentimicrobium TaxID=2677434 RepID=UPI001551CE23|nr:MULTISPECIES: ABC transporter substrate-binding protein [unclassified Lentimicrobium]NPD45418.1 ABC transporter substrate-binding protein [Lentimicrobium sp. S6]NPD83780.1 ABC transporter substrate-binding protein [Lentimicrobium sp. L6]
MLYLRMMRIRNLKFKLKSGLYVLGLIFFVSCGLDPLEENKSIFKYNESNGLASLDPVFSKDLACINVCEQIYNGLVQLDSNLLTIPSIAKSWNISSDFLLYTFYLNTEVYFHDNECFEQIEGRRVLAEDFVYSLSRVLDPKVASPGLWIFDKVDQTWNSNGFHALNDSTLQIKLKEPYSPFLSLLTTKYCSVIPIEAIDYYQDEFRNHPVGTGPFQFKYWEEGLKLVLIKNENYFEEGLPILDAVNVSFLVDKQSEFLFFLQGKIDYISGISPALSEELITSTGDLNPKYHGKFQMLKTPYLNTEYIGILMDTSLAITQNSPLRSLAFRKALNYAIDRKKMLKYIQKNIGEAAEYGFIPTGLWPNQYPRAKGYDYQPQKARELFEQAKNDLGISVFPAIGISATSKSVDICKYLQHEWSQYGIETHIELNQWAALREMVANSKTNLFRASWIADYPDAENYLLLFNSQLFSPKGPNYTHFHLGDYDRKLKMLNFDQNIDEKFNSYRVLDSIIMANASVIPLFYDEVIRFISSDIHGFKPNSMNLMVLKSVKKRK